MHFTVTKPSPKILWLLKQKLHGGFLLLQYIITEKQSHQINLPWRNKENDSRLTDSPSYRKPQVELWWTPPKTSIRQPTDQSYTSGPPFSVRHAPPSCNYKGRILIGIGACMALLCIG